MPNVLQLIRLHSMTQVTLNSFKHFAHNKSSATLWLDPQSEGT